MHTLGGRYRLTARLGTGGMAEVWRGYDRVLGRPVAVKVLAPHLVANGRLRAKVLAEARSAAGLSHPNVASVYDFGESRYGSRGRVPYIVMELVDGQTLADRLDDGLLPWRDMVGVGAQIAAALAAAHAHGVVHRDIKPANIMLTEAGVKVVDFGIAAAAGGADTGELIFGTPAYTAPERLLGQPVEPASDVYALGLLMYRGLTGVLPWAAETPTEMVSAHCYVEPAPLPPIDGLPPEVASLCERCLRKLPEQRPTSLEAARVLAAAVGLVPVPPAAVSSPARAPAPAQRVGSDEAVAVPAAAGASNGAAGSARAARAARESRTAGAVGTAGATRAADAASSTAAPAQRAAPRGRGAPKHRPAPDPLQVVSVGLLAAAPVSGPPGAGTLFPRPVLRPPMPRPPVSVRLDGSAAGFAARSPERSQPSTARPEPARSSAGWASLLDETRSRSGSAGEDWAPARADTGKSSAGWLPARSAPGRRAPATARPDRVRPPVVASAGKGRRRRSAHRPLVVAGAAFAIVAALIFGAAHLTDPGEPSTALAEGPSGAQAAGDRPERACQVQYVARATGPRSFGAELFVRNAGRAEFSDWTLVFTLPAGQHVTGTRGAGWTQVAQTVTLYGGASLETGHTAAVVLTGDSIASGEPTGFTLNGTQCRVVPPARIGGSTPRPSVGPGDPGAGGGTDLAAGAPPPMIIDMLPPTTPVTSTAATSAAPSPTVATSTPGGGFGIWTEEPTTGTSATPTPSPSESPTETPTEKPSESPSPSEP